MKNRHHRWIREVLRRTLSTALVISLLVTQQGFLVLEAFAANVVGKTVVRTSGGSVVGNFPGAPGQNLAPLSLLTGGSPSLQGALPETAGLFSLPPAAGTSAAAQAAASAAGPVRVPVLTPAVEPKTPAAFAAQAAAPSALRTAPAVASPVAAPSVAHAANEQDPGGVAGLNRLARASAVPGIGALNRFFDSSRSRRESASIPTNAGDRSTARRPALERPAAGNGLRFFLVREGEAPLVADGRSLREMLAADPALLEELNGSGRVRIVTDNNPSGNGLAKENVAAVEALLRSVGVNARSESESVSIDWKGGREKADGPAHSKEGVGSTKEAGDLTRKWIIGPIAGIFREIKFLGRTLAASYAPPLWSEVLGGFVSKSAPLAFSAATYWAVIGPSHPWLLGGAIGISLFLEVFHGIFLNTWNEFQNNLKKLRGMGYQIGFTWAYMQSFGAALRTLSWAAAPGKTVPVWSPVYWKDLIVMSVLGTFFGTLGINGLNALYEKGRIRRWQRSAIQQVRDLLMLAAGPLFATGSMTLFWAVFGTSQAIDFTIYMLGTRAKRRTVLYAASAEASQTAEFSSKFPVEDQRGKPGPLKQAWQGIVEGPFGRAGRWIGRLFRRGPPAARPPVNGADAPRAPPARAAKRAPDSLSEVDLRLDPERKYHPSPEDWRDELFYLIMVDRFAKGETGRPIGDPAEGGTRHGGDLNGIIEKLDYLQKAGVTTLVMTPVTHSLPEAYHGYATMHFLDIDPHLGTVEDFKRLIAQAHKRGIRVLMDLVVNHTGPVFDYKDGDADGTPWMGRQKETVWKEALRPSELAKDEHFTRMGKIRDWNDSGQSRRGDFPPNYRHVATDRPETRRLMIDIAKYWMKEADIDGFRLDAIRHVAADFWPHFMREVRGYAKEMGKENFLLLGENSTGVDAEIRADIDAQFDTLYNYPAYRRENYALHGAAPTRMLEDSLHRTRQALGDAAGRLLRFIDLHDTYRFLRTKEPVGALHAALAYLMFSTGIPLVYYGTEQAFRQDVQSLDPEGPHLPADPRNREDMFADGQFKSDSSAGDKFDETSPTFRHLRRYAVLRKAYAPLRRGGQFVRWSDPSGAGIYAFSRIYEGEEVLVVMNTARQAREATMWVDSGLTPAGTTLTDALDPHETVETFAPEGGGSKATVGVPGLGVRVFVRKLAGTDG